MQIFDQGPHPGEVKHVSIPLRVTVADGEPVEVVNVQLPVFVVAGPFKFTVILAVVVPFGPVTPGPDVMPTEGSPVQLPTSCTPGTGVPLPLSKVSVTVPPKPLVNEEGDASRIRLPLAVIGAVAVAPAALNVRVAVLVLSRPLVLTVVITHPVASVALAVLPAVLTPSTEPEPIPRLAKAKLRSEERRVGKECR